MLDLTVANSYLLDPTLANSYSNNGRVWLGDGAGGFYTVTYLGETFQLRGFVQDARNQGGSTSEGNATGVFQAAMDVLMTNANLASMRFGETQELRMDATNPGSVRGSQGTFTLDVRRIDNGFRFSTGG